MIKFLIYLFLIYFVVRFVFGRMFGSVVKTKVFHYRTDVHNHYNEPSDKKKEGTVTIQQTTENKKSGNDSKLGEYVDYEEVN